MTSYIKIFKYTSGVLSMYFAEIVMSTNTIASSEEILWCEASQNTSVGAIGWQESNNFVKKHKQSIWSFEAAQILHSMASRQASNRPAVDQWFHNNTTGGIYINLCSYQWHIGGHFLCHTIYALLVHHLSTYHSQCQCYGEDVSIHIIENVHSIYLLSNSFHYLFSGIRMNSRCF